MWFAQQAEREGNMVHIGNLGLTGSPDINDYLGQRARPASNLLT